MKSVQRDQILFTFTDLRRLFLRHRSRIKSAAVVGGLLALALLLLREPQYKVDSTFKQTNKQSDITVNMKEMFQQLMTSPAESGTIAVMQSNEVIKGAVEELGMQVVCAPDFFIVRAAKKIRDNLCAEFGNSPSDPEKFSFSKVSYSGERPLALFLKLRDGGSYQLYDSNKQLLGEAKLGARTSFPSGHLTLNRFPKNAGLDQFYSVTVNPLIKTIVGLRSKLKVTPHKLDKSILQFTFFCRDRILGAEFVNHLMLSYQNFLKRENDDICQKQLHYLEKRQEELMGYYDKALQEHSAYLQENLAKNGFIGFAQEIETLSEPKNFYTSKLFDVDLELKRLHDTRETQFMAEGEKSKHPGKAKRQQVLQEKKRNEKMAYDDKRKELQSRLENCELEQMRSEASIHSINEEISQFGEQVKEAALLLQSIEKQDEIPPTPSLLKEPKSAIAQFVKQIASSLNTPQDETAQEKLPSRSQNISYLKEFISQLEQKRQTLEEDFQLQQGGSDEFSGLNLATAQGLLVEYTRQRDSLQAQMRELVFLREQLGKPGFEMSSLGEVFDDSVIRDLVNKASEIALQLKDENNRSTREQERLIETLNTQKNFLSHYLFQTVELKRLRLKLFGDKIVSLQQATRSLLQSEKELLKNKLQELNGKMGDLPDKWRRESLLMLKKEIGAMMLEGVSQLVETKSLGQHTFQIASKPLDKAFPPVSPQPPKILFLSLVAAFLAGLGCYFLVFCKALIKGLPSSDETLRLSGFPVSGRISPYCSTDLSQVQQKDLETLRCVLEFLTSQNKGPGGMAAVCIGGNYPDYSLPLAELLAMRGLRVIVVQCVFDKVVHPDEMPGLWQYLQGQTADLPLRRHSTYDLLTSGGTSRHGSEILCSAKFSNFLSELKQRYDVVLLYSSAEPANVEGFSLLRIADAAVVTFQQENKDGLEAYCEWAGQKGDRSATFIYAEEFT